MLVACILLQALGLSQWYSGLKPEGPLAEGLQAVSAVLVLLLGLFSLHSAKV